jgi:hypothetical protein
VSGVGGSALRAGPALVPLESDASIGPVEALDRKPCHRGLEQPGAQLVEIIHEGELSQAIALVPRQLETGGGRETRLGHLPHEEEDHVGVSAKARLVHDTAQPQTRDVEPGFLA